MSREDSDLKELLQQLLVLELFDHGVSQVEIGKKLGKRKKWVNGFLRGVKRRGVPENAS